MDERKWQFPSGRLSPGETPLECALRELEEEIYLTVLEQPVDWSIIKLPQNEKVIKFYWHFCTGEKVKLYTKYIICEQTIEFYYHAVLFVNDINMVQVKDNEEYGRRVELLDSIQIDGLATRGLLCPASKLQWLAIKQQNNIIKANKIT